MKIKKQLFGKRYVITTSDVEFETLRTCLINMHADLINKTEISNEYKNYVFDMYVKFVHASR